MTFEPGPVNPQPFSAPMSLVPRYDVIERLPPGAADRLRALRQRFHDLNVLIPKHDVMHEASTARIMAEQRLQRLLAHPHENGFNLKPDHPSAIEQQRLVDKLTDDLKRLNELSEVRSATWHAASHVLTACEGWLRDGVPPGVALEDHEGEVPKLLKGENGLLDAIENRRRRVRELRASLNRIASSPFPSAYSKGRMREMVEALAQAGTPDVTSLIEFDRDIAWPTQRVTSSIYNAQPGAVGFAELEAAVPLLIWLHKDALIGRLDAEIDAEADDKAALTHEARQQQEAEVQGDLLAVERDEAALTWSAQSQGLPVEHRKDCSPLATLGCRLVTVPATNPPPGSSPGMSWLRR